MSRNISNQVKMEMRNDYKNNPVTIVALARKYNVSAPTAGKICKDLPKWRKTIIFSPNLQEDWFEIIDTEEKAYYLGLFFTDGNVYTSNKTQAVCSITQKEEDDYILRRWLRLVESNRKISHDGRGCSQASVLSNKMKKDLSKYGVTLSKTSRDVLPQIPTHLMPHLIRGIFDGDGNIEAKWYIPSDGRHRFKHKISFCGSRGLMEDINDFLCKTLSLDVPRLPYDYKNKRLSEIQYTNYNDIEKIGDYLYGEATIFLYRKKELYDLIKNRIKERQQCAN